MQMNPYGKARLRELLPHPSEGANKYTRGKLVLMAGSAAYPGAACLSALASQRMGAGYTEVITDKRAVETVRSVGPSLVVASDEAWFDRPPAVATERHPCAVAVGSGFDSGEGRTARLLFCALEDADAPVLVDGGALGALASDEGRALCKRRFVEGRPTVATPHGGEAARLAKPFDLPCDDPSRLARSLSLAYGMVVVLKGPDTWISDGDDAFCMDEGTAALSKAGTGDVLAGMIGSLLAQGLDPLDACMLGSTLHARAGKMAADELTDICVSAEDVVRFLPHAIRSLSSEDGR